MYAIRSYYDVNLGNAQFAEQAEQFGIADEGFSIQPTFFDADQDGDLDMYLVNQPFDQLARYIHSPETVASYPVTDRRTQQWLHRHAAVPTRELGIRCQTAGKSRRVITSYSIHYTKLYEFSF